MKVRRVLAEVLSAFSVSLGLWVVNKLNQVSERLARVEERVEHIYSILNNKGNRRRKRR